LCIIRHTKSVLGLHENCPHAACMPVSGPNKKKRIFFQRKIMILSTPGGVN